MGTLHLKVKSDVALWYHPLGVTLHVYVSARHVCVCLCLYLCLSNFLYLH